MKSLIVCVSVSNGNTRRVASRMAAVLDDEVVEPEAVDPDSLGQYDLVGFGSGIYFMLVHPRLCNLIRRLPNGGAKGRRAFTFFTSGAAAPPFLDYGGPMRRLLTSKGFDTLGSFSCRGFDKAGPLRFIGGVNKGRPNERDLDRAAEFAAGLRERIETEHDLRRDENCPRCRDFWPVCTGRPLAYTPRTETARTATIDPVKPATSAFPVPPLGLRLDGF